MDLRDLLRFPDREEKLHEQSELERKRKIKDWDGQDGGLDSEALDLGVHEYMKRRNLDDNGNPLPGTEAYEAWRKRRR